MTSIMATLPTVSPALPESALAWDAVRGFAKVQLSTKIFLSSDARAAAANGWLFSSFLRGRATFAINVACLAINTSSSIPVMSSSYMHEDSATRNCANQSLSSSIATCRSVLRSTNFWWYSSLLTVTGRAAHARMVRFTYVFFMMRCCSACHA